MFVRVSQLAVILKIYAPFLRHPGCCYNQTGIARLDLRPHRCEIETVSVAYTGWWFWRSTRLPRKWESSKVCYILYTDGADRTGMRTFLRTGKGSERFAVFESCYTLSTTWSTCIGFVSSVSVCTLDNSEAIRHSLRQPRRYTIKPA